MPEPSLLPGTTTSTIQPIDEKGITQLSNENCSKQTLEQADDPLPSIPNEENGLQALNTIENETKVESKPDPIEGNLEESLPVIKEDDCSCELSEKIPECKEGRGSEVTISEVFEEITPKEEETKSQLIERIEEMRSKVGNVNTSNTL